MPLRGRVHELVGGVYRVRLEGGDEVEASIRGRLKHGARRAGHVVVGDRVRLERAGAGAWTIEHVEPRDGELSRRVGGGRAARPVVANLDRALVVVAAVDPPSGPELIDRLLALVASSGIRPLLVINKLDLPGATDRAAQLRDLYESIGYRAFAVSALRGTGLDALRAEVCRGTSALIGPSGVGKSSLLNALQPELALRTGDLSRKTRTGRHTTVAARLVPLRCGGLVADTPGFAEVGFAGLAVEDLADAFPDFAEPAGRCRFRGCSHVREPDCGVRDAVDAGEIAASRYASWVKLREEASG